MKSKTLSYKTKKPKTKRSYVREILQCNTEPFNDLGLKRARLSFMWSGRMQLNSAWMLRKPSYKFWEGFCTKSPLNSLNTVLFSLQRNVRDESQWKRVEDDKQRRKTLLTGWYSFAHGKLTLFAFFQSMNCHEYIDTMIIFILTLIFIEKVSQFWIIIRFYPSTKLTFCPK